MSGAICGNYKSLYSNVLYVAYILVIKQNDNLYNYVLSTHVLENVMLFEI